MGDRDTSCQQFVTRSAKLMEHCGNLKYRLAIFDCDGTLADTLPWMRSVFNQLAHEHGFRPVEPHEVERFRNLHGLALLRELKLPISKLPRVLNSMRQRMAEHTEPFALFAGISEVLRRLSAYGVHLAVVSSNSQANVERVLGPDNARLIAHFRCGVSMFGKSAKLRQVIRTIAIPHYQAIYVGDEIRDAEAARKAGVNFGAVTWGQHGEDVLRAQEPALVFSTVHGIADQLLTVHAH
jgi:phosphoglycolate phosphatase